ncbi:MAG: heme-copper oxidase subunit III [Oscillatoriales cyanobacterium]|nr:MAG: heme-copper oxidase subunit III [Oscillatoriales cyanobacterium]
MQQIPAIDPEKTALNYHHSAEIEAHGEEHPDHRMLGVLVFLGSEGMIFMGMFAAYLIYRAMAPMWPPEGTPDRELLLPGINDATGMRNWLLVTIAMGVVFLCGQVYEYTHLEFGLTTNLYASCFYVLTAFHGLHVTFGVVLMAGVVWRSRVQDHYSSEHHFGIEATEIYWHFVDVIWIVLFVLLYII